MTMGHLRTLSFALLLPASTLAQTDTLRHLDPATSPIAWPMSGNDLWGYYLGHNAYGDEGFGERYDVPEGTVVHGGIAHFTGTSGGSSAQGQLRIRTVNASGLPGTVLATRNFALNSVPLDGSPHPIMFNAPVTVNGPFFITYELGDYSHHAISDTISLLAGPEGSRPASDNAIGRNACKWHGSSTWRDFLNQNESPFSIYFALYPVVDPAATSVSELDRQATSVRLANVHGGVALSVHAPHAALYDLSVLDMAGRMLHSGQLPVPAGAGTHRVDLSAVPAGTYVLVLQSGPSRHALRFVME